MSKFNHTLALKACGQTSSGATDHVMDEAWVKAMLEEAADTLRCLPRGLAKPKLTYWPDVVQETAAFLLPSVGYSRKPIAPPPQAIDRMDQVLVWLLACDEEARKIVWARACRIPWRRLEDQDGRSYVTLRKIASRGHDQIRTYLLKNPQHFQRFAI